MNHKQINELKVGNWYKLIEDYIYDFQFETLTIPKGTEMQFVTRFLNGWRFKFEIPPKGFSGIGIGFGRSRLLKLKLKEIKEAEE